MLANLSREVLVQVTNIHKAHELWAAVANMFSSQSRSRVNNIRVALSNAEKGTQTVGAYFAYMRGLADELAAAGKPLDEDEQISYIIVGLGMDLLLILEDLLRLLLLQHLLHHLGHVSKEG